MTAKVEAVLFDYGLVLTGPPVPAAWQGMKTLLDAGEEAFTAAYWRYRLDYDRGTLSGDRYWQAVAEELGHETGAAELETLTGLDTQLWTAINQPMVDWALRLRAAGTRTGILSNLGDSIMHGVLTELPWMSGFDHLTFSHRLGLVKPDAAIYRHAADGLGVVPDAILFVDDREENVAGALTAGLQAIRYGAQADFIQEMQSRGFGQLWAAGRA